MLTRFFKPKHSLFLIILSAAFIFRLANFDYPLLNSETHRDYLIARHIARYHEFVETGPCCLWNGSFGEYRKTPIYHYLLSALIFLFDNIYFLEIVNLVLGVIPLVVIYIIVSRFFLRKAALVSTFLFGFSQETFKTALFVWEPHLMQPFLYLSYLCLFYAYIKKSLKLLVAASLLFIFAGSIHSPVYGATPAFFLVAILALKSQKVPKVAYFTVFGITLTFAILFHLPIILFMVKNHLFLALHANFLVDAPKAYLENLQTFASLLIKSFYYTSEKSLPLLGKLLVLANLFFLITYIKSPNFKNHRRFFLFAAIFVIQFLALASFFRAHAWHYYLLPIFGAFIVLLGVSVSEQKNPLLRAASFIWLVLIFYTFSMFHPLKITAFQNQRQIEPAIQAIQNKIKEIQIKKDYEQANFFKVEVLATGSESPINANLSFSVPLEKRLQTRMFNLVDSSQGYIATNSDDYVFVVCHSLLRKIDLMSECLLPFTQNHPNHTVLEEIYQGEPFTIYLAEKIRG